MQFCRACLCGACVKNFMWQPESGTPSRLFSFVRYVRENIECGPADKSTKKARKDQDASGCQFLWRIGNRKKQTDITYCCAQQACIPTRLLLSWFVQLPKTRVGGQIQERWPVFRAKTRFGENPDVMGVLQSRHLCQSVSSMFYKWSLKHIYVRGTWSVLGWWLMRPRRWPRRLRAWVGVSDASRFAYAWWKWRNSARRTRSRTNEVNKAYKQIGRSWFHSKATLESLSDRDHGVLQ